MDDRVPAQDAINAVRVPEPAQQGPQQQGLRRATDFLLDNCRTGSFTTRYDKYRRYADLQLNDMFNSLVTVYTSLFTSQWPHFKRLIEEFRPEFNYSAYTYAARVYISAWFHDQYAYVREATRDISPLAFNERFHHEELPYSREYDAFLALLSASIRPTQIRHTPEDTLFIPTFGSPDWTAENPFPSIVSYVANSDAFYGILQLMKERRLWNIQTVPTNTMGRPCWLFDWFEQSEVCAWFPREGNYTDTDVTLAYIVGVACTPKLGQRDVDDWMFLFNEFPPADRLLTQPRVIPRRFFGAYEVRTIERDIWQVSPQIAKYFIDNLNPTVTPVRRKKSTSGMSGSTMALTSASTGAETSGPTEEPREAEESPTFVLPSFNRYRIIDWVYHSRVIMNKEMHTRTGALKIISLN